MALSANTAWEVRTTGADTNSGGFNVGNANMATDGAATSANTSAPVFSSASYTFVAGDVGAWLFIKSGTNWIPGWYQIASVAGGAATLTAGIGTAQLFGGATVLNTAAGAATVASPSGATWSVDYSQQDAAQFSFTDLVIDGATNTDFTSAAFPIGKNMVGNLINITSGTGFTVQFVEVVSVTVATGRADKSLGTLSSTGGTGKLGGAFLTIAKATTAASATMVRSNKVFVKAGSGYTTTTGIVLSATGGTPSTANPPNRLIGYTTFRGDNGSATITLSTNSGLSAISMGTNGWIVQNFVIDCNNLATSTGIATTTLCVIKNCLIKNFKTVGITTTNFSNVFECEITGGAAGASAAILAGNGTVTCITRNYIHDNACTGIGTVQDDFVSHNLITNNTGATSDGITTSNAGTGTVILNNTIYGCGRHGINIVNTVVLPFFMRNNLLVNNAGYGVQLASAAGTPAFASFDGNAYFNNTSGTRNNADDTVATNPINGVAPYVNSLDVILTANPFTNAAGGDFTLNTNAGGGAAARASGTPSTFPGVADTPGHIDMGVFQHADPPVAVINQVINRYSYEGDY